MIPAESFWAANLHTAPEGESITRILAAAIAAVEPGAAVRKFVQREGDALSISGQTYNLSTFRRVYLLGIGKAAPAMSAALAEILGETLAAGLVIAKHIPPESINHSPYSIIQGGHPIPDERSLLAGEKVVEFVSALGPNDLLLCLISGGGSALVTAPVDGVSLADLQSLTSALLACGARVDEINVLRRRLDRIKGGGVARLSNGAAIISLILSDVVGNRLEAIASGPTAPDPSTHADALSIIAKYGLEHQIPLTLNHALFSSPETPKPGDPLFEHVQNVIVGSNLSAAQAALKQAEEEGFHPYLLRADLQGEARDSAFELATFLRQARQTGDPVPPPACIVAGGETTVTLRGDGQGGRNTELALAAVTELADFPGVMLVTLATDGEDGPTNAAGAVVTGETYSRARALGMNPTEYLNRNDSYSFFEALGDLLKPGPTGTNVNDLTFLFTF
ncbi:MAG: glycerate kinase [Elusimicrobiota bacterium]